MTDISSFNSSGTSAFRLLRVTGDESPTKSESGIAIESTDSGIKRKLYLPAGIGPTSGNDQEEARKKLKLDGRPRDNDCKYTQAIEPGIRLSGTSSGESSTKTSKTADAVKKNLFRPSNENESNDKAMVKHVQGKGHAPYFGEVVCSDANHCVWSVCKHCKQATKIYVKSDIAKQNQAMGVSRVRTAIVKSQTFCSTACQMKFHKSSVSEVKNSDSCGSYVIALNAANTPSVGDAPSMGRCEKVSINKPNYSVGNVIASRSGKGDWKRAGVITEVYYTKYDTVNYVVIWLRPKDPPSAKERIENCYKQCQMMDPYKSEENMSQHARFCSLRYLDFRFQHNAKLPIGAGIIHESEILGRLCFTHKQIFKPKALTTIKLTTSPTVNIMRHSSPLHDRYTDFQGAHSSGTTLGHNLTSSHTNFPQQPSSMLDASNTNAGPRMDNKEYDGQGGTGSRKPSYHTGKAPQQHSVILLSEKGRKAQIRMTLTRAKVEILKREWRLRTSESIPPLLRVPPDASNFVKPLEIFAMIYGDVIEKVHWFHHTAQTDMAKSMTSIAQHLYNSASSYHLDRRFVDIAAAINRRNVKERETPGDEFLSSSTDATCTADNSVNQYTDATPIHFADDKVPEDEGFAIGM